MKKNAFEEKQLSDGTYQFIFNKRGSAFGLVLVSLLFLLFLIESIVFAVAEPVMFIAPCIVISSYLSYLLMDQSKLLIEINNREFALKKLVGNITLKAYIIPTDEIDKFIFEAWIRIRALSIKELFRNFMTFQYGGITDLVKTAVAIRDINNKMYVVNRDYGSADERERLKNILNEKLDLLRAN